MTTPSLDLWLGGKDVSPPKADLKSGTSLAQDRLAWSPLTATIRT